ncbi:MAG: hypothetical protein ABI321_18280 [Polyangia bacterium]
MSPSNLIRATLFAALFVVGCGGPKTTTFNPGDMSGGTDGGGGNSCTPGNARSCICLGGGTGTQVCRDTGASYGSCGGCSGDGGTLTISDAGAGNPCGDCQGCCDGTSCVPFAEQSNTKCGQPGTTCSGCSGQTCNTADGTCVTANAGGCSNSNCAGCCGQLNGQSHCYVDTASACGSGGGQCATCTPGTQCDSGACDNSLDPAYKYKVTISSVQVYNTDGSSNCWDNNGFGFGCGQPDLKVCIGYDPGTGAIVSGCTTEHSDVSVDNGKDPTDNAATDSTTWTGTDGVLTSGSPATTFYVPGSAFINGKTVITVYDDDLNADDVIGSLFVKGSTYSTTGFMNGPFGRVVVVHYRID